MPSVCLHLSLYSYKIISIAKFLEVLYLIILRSFINKLFHINFLGFKLIDLIYIAVGEIYHKISHIKYFVTCVR